MELSQNEFIFQLKKSFEQIDIALTDKMANQFYDFYNLLIEKNKVMNLTSITEPYDVIEKHFIDSVALAKFYDFSKVSSCIDMGTGAGFPGIPLKIVFPHLNIMLLDSLNKRIDFLNSTIIELGLDEISTIHSRAEDGARNKNLREKYDICVSRAVSNLSTLSEYCIPFVKINGSFISYKSGNVSEEVNSAKKAIEILGGKIENVNEFVLPDSDYRRSFVNIKKVKCTGNKYPRKAGMPKNSPL
jgi:16S rRNA (guanine527-N7)-methyltransferase